MKRFTETKKWADAWFMDLPAKWKIAWIWAVENCDHAGIIDANPRLMSFLIGENLDGDEFLRAMQGRVTKPKAGKWFIPSFIAFQYGTELNPLNSAHRGVLRRLEEAGIDCPVSVLKEAPTKPLQSPCQGAQDKDKDKDKDKDTEKQKDKVLKFTPPLPEEVTAYSAEIGYPLNGQAWCDAYAQKGWMVGKTKMKDWKAAVRNWKSNGWTPSGASPVRPIDPPIPAKRIAV